MTTLEHTDSEQRLHRTLYILKYLRAMLLHFALLIFAVGLFFFAGIDSVYPLATDIINTLEAKRNNPQFQHMYRRDVVLLIVVWIYAIALLYWMYNAIVKVWRRSLRFMAVFLMFGVLWSLVWIWPPFIFSLNYLNPLFTFFVALGYILICWLSIDGVLALWGVSNSKDVASFRATLNPILTSGAWGYLNKLLDLPCPLLRHPRSLAAYMIALIGAIILIGAVTYIGTGGAALTKRGHLTETCTSSTLLYCEAQSAQWGRETLLYYVVALGSLPLAAAMQSSAKSIGGMSVKDALVSSSGEYILYLRPFQSDEVLLPKPKLPLITRLISLRPFPLRIEDELFDVADGYLPLIAVGSPKEEERRVGGEAYREYLDDSKWQSIVAKRMAQADSVVLVIKDTDGVKWELSRIVGDGHAGKTLFLFDSAAKDEDVYQKIVEIALDLLRAGGLISSDFRFRNHALGFFFEDDELVEIVNANWSATSYRTAFSSFLARRAGDHQ